MAKGEVGCGTKRSNGLAVVMVLFGIRLPVCRTVGYRTTTLEAFNKPSYSSIPDQIKRESTRVYSECKYQGNRFVHFGLESSFDLISG